MAATKVTTLDDRLDRMIRIQQETLELTHAVVDLMERQVYAITPTKRELAAVREARAARRKTVKADPNQGGRHDE